MTGSQPIDPATAFAELSRIKLGETDLDGVLDQIAALAKRTIPGAAEVSVTLVRDAGARTAAVTGDLALHLDESQYERGAGPCLDASAAAATFSLPDMSREPRYPEFSARARAAGCGSSLSVGMPLVEAVTGALNVYGTEPCAFDADAVSLAESFAGYAAVALGNAHLYDVQAGLSQQMQEAMRSRAVIEQAKGIIMGQRRCGADEAFAILSKASQDSNRKLRDVAASLVERATGGAR